MLSLKSFLRSGRSRPDTLPAVEATKPSSPPGYFQPMPASELLATTRRQQWLQSLWDYSSLPKEMYRQYYLAPLEHCVALMQEFPLTETGKYARPGGMADYMLETVSYAARLSKSYMLPVGAPPEEQAAQSAAWNAVVVYAAMLPALEYLCHLHVELESGKRWFPLLDAPAEPYRFRFAPESSPERRQSFGAMLAWRIIPPEAIVWLSAWPETLKTLSTCLTGFRAQSGVVNAIVSEAIHLVLGSNTKSAPIPPLTASSLTTATVPVTALPAAELLSAVAITEGTEPEVLSLLVTENEVLSPDGEDFPTGNEEQDETDALLSMMGFSEASGDVQPEPVTPVTNSQSGEAFWEWLLSGCRSGQLVINKPDARIHLVAGFVFLGTPGIFHQYLSETGTPKSDKVKLQRAFERLNYHRQDRGTMYTCHLYENEQHEGRFTKLNGYLIPASKLFTVDTNPGNNPCLITA